MCEFCNREAITYMHTYGFCKLHRSRAAALLMIENAKDAETYMIGAYVLDNLKDI